MDKKSKITVGALCCIIIASFTVIILMVSGVINIGNSKKLEQTSIETNENNTIMEELSSDEASNIAKDVLNKYYNDIFYGYKPTYCGERDNSDELESNSFFYKSKTYNSLNDLKKYLSTYLTSSLISKYVLDSEYVEKNGYLYCHMIPRGGLTVSNVNYNITSSNNSSIKGVATVKYSAEGNGTDEMKNDFELIKENGVWKISSVTEQAQSQSTDVNTVAKSIVDKYFNDIYEKSGPAYCGEIDYNDELEDNMFYYKSLTYNSLSEVRSYLSTYIVVDLVNKYANSSNYIEQNNHLYCHIIPRGGVSVTNKTYSITETSEYIIRGNVNITGSSEGNSNLELKHGFELMKENGVWKLSNFMTVE